MSAIKILLCVISNYGPVLNFNYNFIFSGAYSNVSNEVPLFLFFFFFSFLFLLIHCSRL
jgi:hypothetical protein